MTSTEMKLLIEYTLLHIYPFSLLGFSKFNAYIANIQLC